MRSRTQKQPQVKKEPCQVLDDIDVDGSFLPTGYEARDFTKAFQQYCSITMLQVIFWCNIFAHLIPLFVQLRF